MQISLKVKLGDFGISKKLESANELAQTSLGTPYYLSPELCSAQPYGRKTDVWMLGCLLYELCALERPFSGENISVLMAKILKEEPKAVSPGYSGLIHRLISSLLAKNQQKRPEIEELLQLKEIRLEIRGLVSRFPQLYGPLEELYCKDLGENCFLAPKHPAPGKKKSLIKPLSYSTLPGLEQLKDEAGEKFSTPHNQKAPDQNDKNSILNVIHRHAKKQTMFKAHEESAPRREEEPAGEPGEPEQRQASNSRVSFEQYLTKKLEKPEEQPLKSALSKKEIPLEDGGKKSQPEPPRKKAPQNLEIIEEKGGAGKAEEEKRSANGKLMISPNNKPKKSSPKAFEILPPGANEAASQRSRLFLEFLKEKLGEEKFLKVKALLQAEDASNAVERKRNEILEIIGIKNVELLKFLSVLCSPAAEGQERRKGTVEGWEGRDEGRVERTSSGYGKLDGFHSRK